MHIISYLVFYDIAYGPISPLYAGTAPAGAELNGKVRTFSLILGIFANVNTLMFWPVPDSVGTCFASKREGSGCGAAEEVVGMVRGPSEGLVMF